MSNIKLFTITVLLCVVVFSCKREVVRPVINEKLPKLKPSAAYPLAIEWVKTINKTVNLNAPSDYNLYLNGDSVIISGAFNGMVDFNPGEGAFILNGSEYSNKSSFYSKNGR